MSSSPSRRDRVLVLGGGVSGATTAIRLAQRGVDVTLLERAVFPREKVCGCCLGAAGIASLDALGLGQSVRVLGQPLDRFEGWFLDNRSSQACRAISLPIRPGVAIARGVLDTLLIDAAKKAGVTVWQPVEGRVSSIGESAVAAEFRKPLMKTWLPAGDFDLVIVATGLTGNFRSPGLKMETSGDPLPWSEPPSGPIGLSKHVSAPDWAIEPGVIQMICNDDGYVGIVRLPDGTLDVAAAVLPGSTHSPSADSTTARGELVAAVVRVMEQSVVASGNRQWRDQLLDPRGWLVTPPLRRRRVAASGRIVAIGDTSGYVEPLTGEGMTWGIESGIAVADLWVTMNGRVDEFERRWQDQSIRLQSGRRQICNWVTRGLRQPQIRKVSATVLRNAAWVARPLTWNLSRGPLFASTCSGTTDVQ